MYLRLKLIDLIALHKKPPNNPKLLGGFWYLKGMLLLTSLNTESCLQHHPIFQLRVEVLSSQ